MKKEYDFKNAQRGRFYRKGAKAKLPPGSLHARVVLNTTPQVHAALIALLGTGLFGDGCDSASVAEELVRRALLDPAILPYWRKP